MHNNAHDFTKTLLIFPHAGLGRMPLSSYIQFRTFANQEVWTPKQAYLSHCEITF